ncbi:MAG: succinylglutamate desuccinylase/aspartoacylase family protein [Anaerolineae bacterium]|nr:succinylglutamate desuccinylase/aspartoacylase family protein [Anaerolineae bacterium]
MTEPLVIGTAQGIPGRLSYGKFEAVRLPSGGDDHFPVVIAQGREDGPTLWITANIHGNEVTGLAALHKLLDDELAARLRGALVAVPTLNPSGLVERSRSAHYLGGDDPNRLFPARVQNPETKLPSALQAAYARLFEVMKSTADYLIDLHCMGVQSIPIALRDPVYYTDKSEKGAAGRLFETVNAMQEAFGLSIINEFGGGEYLRQDLHRSVSGAMLNCAYIPAFTVELGGYPSVEPAARDAAVAGLRNVMRWAGMLDGAPEPVTGIKRIDPGYPVRRARHPNVPCGCIVHYLVEVGDRVEPGQPVAELRDIYGRPVGEGGLLRSDYDGFVVAFHRGVVYYENETVITMAVRDDGEMVLPYPA